LTHYHRLTDRRDDHLADPILKRLGLGFVGSHEAITAYRIVHIDFEEGSRAFVCHADGFEICPRDMAAIYKKAAGKGAAPVPVYVVNNVPGDEAGLIRVRQVLQDEYGLLFLDREEMPFPEWLVKRDRSDPR
jgi:hypothetical protein